MTVLAGAAAVSGLINVMLPDHSLHVFFPNAHSACDVGTAQARVTIRVLGENSLKMALFMYALAPRVKDPAVRHTLALANFTSSVVMLSTIVSLDARVGGMRRTAIMPWIVVHSVLGAFFLFF